MQSTPPGEPSPFDDGDFYDIMCEGLDYGIDFYVGLAREAKGPVLDIACGTGRILLPVLQAGADADGLDLFQPMLDTRAGRPPHSDYRRPCTAATWPTSRCRAAMP